MSVSRVLDNAIKIMDDYGYENLTPEQKRKLKVK